jgi:uncharacterized MAPEG superfamily protein
MQRSNAADWNVFELYACFSASVITFADEPEKLKRKAVLK